MPGDEGATNPAHCVDSFHVLPTRRVASKRLRTGTLDAMVNVRVSADGRAADVRVRATRQRDAGTPLRITLDDEDGPGGWLDSRFLEAPCDVTYRAAWLPGREIRVTLHTAAPPGCAPSVLCADPQCICGTAPDHGPGT